jgi:hypothetical protein
MILAEEEKIKYEESLSSYVNTLRERSNKDKIQEISEIRGIPAEAFIEAGVFYIGDSAEMLHPLYLKEIPHLGVISPTNKRPIFKNRYIFPINNPDGKVQNLVGYSKEADERYVYGTAKYYRRTDTLWGLENLDLAYQMGYAILTEGITDSLRMRSLGFKNTFAMCGTHKSPYIIRQLNRCRHGVILIPDRDKPGLRALDGWTYLRSLTLLISIFHKDLDEMCASSEDNKLCFLEYMGGAIQWILSAEHQGMESAKERLVIV